MTFSHGTFASLNTSMQSDSSKRVVSGRSKRVSPKRLNGSRDQSVSPGRLSGMTQVMDSLSWSGASGITFPISTSCAYAAPLASIFMPLSVTPLSSSAVTRSAGRGSPLAR